MPAAPSSLSPFARDCYERGGRPLRGVLDEHAGRPSIPHRAGRGCPAHGPVVRRPAARHFSARRAGPATSRRTPVVIRQPHEADSRGDAPLRTLSSTTMGTTGATGTTTVGVTTHPSLADRDGSVTGMLARLQVPSTSCIAAWRWHWAFPRSIGRTSSGWPSPSTADSAGRCWTCGPTTTSSTTQLGLRHARRGRAVRAGQHAGGAVGNGGGLDRREGEPRLPGHACR